MSAVPQLWQLTVTQTSVRRGRVRGMKAALRVVYPEALAQSIPLDAATCVIGRREATGIAALLHPTVSRRHMRVEWCRTSGAHVVLDLGSHNGSRLNGKQLVAGAVPPDPPNGFGAGLRAGPPFGPAALAELTHGDVLQLGDVIAVYQVESGESVEEDLDQLVSLDAVPGQSAAMQRLRQAVGRAGRDPSPVLLVGETGTGKEHVARELHRLSGRTGPLLSINCAALSRELVESQLFGHLRGAFTGALADHPGLFRAAGGGTVFLDEVGDLPLDLQPKLLRALQEEEVLPVGATRAVPVDVRVIAATNRDLTTSVESGTFRRDLYARLALWEIAVPPMRDRRADLLGWIGRFHRRWQAERPEQTMVPTFEFSPAAAERILLADWPENLRGVGRLVHELASRSGNGRIEVDDLPTWLTRPQVAEEVSSTASSAPRSRVRRPTPSRDDLAAAMVALSGSVRAVARHFGRDRRQIYRWMQAFGLEGYRRGRR
jgi:transcriptional regulator with GAF, ATPase, and Fis domain